MLCMPGVLHRIMDSARDFEMHGRWSGDKTDARHECRLWWLLTAMREILTNPERPTRGNEAEGRQAIIVH